MNMWENVPSMAEHKTEITFYPAKNKISDAAVIVFAGGGYSFRAEHEGKGYATAAVRLAVELARAAGKYEGIYLDCAPDNVSARHIYDKLGIVPTGDINHGSTEMIIGF